MSKIAIVGCQQSGKTVFMASLSDYFRVGQRPNQSSWLIPENQEAHKFTEMRNYEMRVKHEWPDATWNTPTSLKWALHVRNGGVTDVEMLEFGGEVFRAAFRDEGVNAQNREAAETLVSYLIDANFVVVLVAMNELFRDKEDQSIFADDIESTWVTRGLLDFVRKSLHKDVGVLIALTQADLYRKELETLGGSSGVLQKKWPMIYALYSDLPVVAVASVSKTTADGRPAEGYTTEGVLPVMKVYSEYLYGSPVGLIEELDSIASDITAVKKPVDMSQFDQNLAKHKQLLEELKSKVAIVDVLYEEVISRHEVVNSEGRRFLEILAPLLARRVELRMDAKLWNGIRDRFPILGPTIDVYEKDTQERYQELLAENARKAAEEVRRREVEELRIVEAAKRDEERRRQLELDERERLAAADRVRIEKERVNARTRAILMRALIVLAILVVIGWGLENWQDSARARRVAELEKQREFERERSERIERENTVKLAEVRKAEAAQKALEEKNRADEIARKRLEEENRRSELELRRQEAVQKEEAERQRLIDLENEKKRLELARQKAEEERALEEERRKRIAEENRKRQIEIAHEETLRKAEEEKQRKIAEEQERQRQEALRIERERQAAEERIRKETAEKASAANLFKRLIDSLNEGVASRVSELLTEMHGKEGFLSDSDKKRLDVVCASAEALKSASAGDEESQLKIASTYYFGNAVIKKNLPLAYSWYLKAAEAGNMVAQYKVGEMLILGDGIAEDVTRAYSYFEKAAAQNSPRALFVVAEMLRMGKGVEKDQKAANRYYERAAILGNADAQMAWSKRLRNGDGMFFSDKKAAAEWLWKAAKSGNGEACYIVGCKYYTGSDGYEFSLANAYKMLKTAKEAGFEGKDLDRKIKACEQVIMEKTGK